MSLLNDDFGGGDFGFGSGGDGFNSLSGRATNKQLAFGDTTQSTIGQGGTDGLGGNIWGKGGMASMALGGLQTLGTLWSAFQQNKMAKKAQKFQERAYNTNLKNSTQVYNTALDERVRARYATENRPEEADAYIRKHRIA